jgi:hypothetical protein
VAGVKRIILQDNLWFTAAPSWANYRMSVGEDEEGNRIFQSMIPVEPRQGCTASNDWKAKGRELHWLRRYLGRKGQNLVVAQQWMRPDNRIDRNLPQWYELFRDKCPRARWFIFYDVLLALRQRGIIGEYEVPDFANPKAVSAVLGDLTYLEPWFARVGYLYLHNRPVVYLWAAHAYQNASFLFRTMKERSIYVMADVQGTKVVPAVDCLTGFTLVVPGTPRMRVSLAGHLGRFRSQLAELESHALVEGIDWIPAGSCQYDDAAFMRARGLGEPPTQILAEKRSEIESALSIAWSYSKRINGHRYILWGTLNNWAEGTTVLPTKRRSPQFSTEEIGHYGFGHLQALRNSLR